MRNRTYLVLMEQLVMVLVFAAAAAICLKIFAFSHQVSEQTGTLSEAALQAQNTAEQVKSCGGRLETLFAESDWNETELCWEVWYDDKWQVTVSEQAAYRLTVLKETAEEDEAAAYIGKACIMVWRTEHSEAECVFQIVTAWQEENTNA